MSDSLIPSTNPYFAVRSTFNHCVDKRGALSLIHDAEPWIVGAMSKEEEDGDMGRTHDGEHIELLLPSQKRAC